MSQDLKGRVTYIRQHHYSADETPDADTLKAYRNHLQNTSSWTSSAPLVVATTVTSVTLLAYLILSGVIPVIEPVIGVGPSHQNVGFFVALYLTLVAATSAFNEYSSSRESWLLKRWRSGGSHTVEELVRAPITFHLDDTTVSWSIDPDKGAIAGRRVLDADTPTTSPALSGTLAFGGEDASAFRLLHSSDQPDTPHLTCTAPDGTTLTVALDALDLPTASLPSDLADTPLQPIRLSAKAIRDLLDHLQDALPTPLARSLSAAS